SISALAFLLLPFAAEVNATVFVVVILIWVITSAALRAPTLALLGRFTPAARQPWIASLFVLGIGLASASAPILGKRITDHDPRIQFGLSAFAVFAVTLAIIWAQRALTRTAPADEPASTDLPFSVFLAALAAILLSQIGFQAHWFLNADRLFAKFTTEGGRSL